MSKPQILLLDEPSHGLPPRIAVGYSISSGKLHSEWNMTIFIVEQQSRMLKNYLIELM